MGKSVIAGAHVALGLILLGASGARAGDLSDRVELHGYGDQDFFLASQNAYLGADDRGSWDNNLIALVGTVTLTEKSKFWTQLESESLESTRFDWYFVDYQFNDQLRLQVGRVKLPLGIYNEIIDARYLQLSALPPTLYQGAADITHDAYQGVGLDYEHPLGGAGSLRAQVWAGNTVADDPEDDLADRRAFGGKFTWNTPLAGLRLIASAFRTQVEIFADGSFQHEDRGILSVDYIAHDFDLKAEYATHQLLGVKGKAYYIQAGHTFAQKWIPYLRYDYVSTDDRLDDDPAFYQNTVVIGLGYRLGNNFSLRVEDHINHGYALPVATDEVAAGAGEKDWNLFVASVNFIF